MKTNKFQRRFYRDWANAKDLYAARVAERETDLQILTDKPIDKIFVREKIRQYRGEIEKYIAKDRRFQAALKPQAVEFSAPRIVKEMSEAAKIANVGPMAAVAGAIAEFIGRDLLKKGHKEVIIENGGDIFIKTCQSRKIKIYAGKSKLSNKLSIKIKSKNTPCGVCASSGTVGHSLSFGSADVAVILAKNALIADAVATATANRIVKQEDLSKALDFASSLKGVNGAVVILGKNIACWGTIELCS